MAKLSVNINKIALIRNSRGHNQPDILQVSRDLLKWGVHGITVHPRPDGRHIRHQDVRDLAKLIANWNTSARFAAELNIEGFPDSDFMQLMEDVKPHQCTLVPDSPEALTSNAGWGLVASQEQLTPVLKKLKALGVRSSLFVDPFTFTAEEQTALAKLKPARIELYTESYARAYGTPEQSAATEVYKTVAAQSASMNIGVNGGHDLNQLNLKYLLTQVGEIEEVSIGHALVCEALYEGLPTTIKNYLKIVNEK